MKNSKDYLDIKRRAEGLVWLLLRELRWITHDSKSCFTQASTIKHVILTMEWLSAIAYGKWTEDVKHFESFYNEINRYSILALRVTDDISCRWKSLCEEIAIKANKTAHYGQEEITLNSLDEFENWKELGFKEGFLNQDNSLLSRILYRDPIYTIKFQGA